jgi:hypothetical protein
MTMLQRLYHEQGQSPWLDNLTRVYLRDGTLGRVVAGMYATVWDVTEPLQAVIRGGWPVDPERLANPCIPLDLVTGELVAGSVR